MCSWAFFTRSLCGQIEARFTGAEVVFASDAEGMFVRLRGTAVQPYSSVWGFGMIEVVGFVVVWSLRTRIAGNEVDGDKFFYWESSVLRAGDSLLIQLASRLMSVDEDEVKAARAEEWSEAVSALGICN